MATIRVDHSDITGLARDMRAVPARAARSMATVTRNNVEFGEANAQRIARQMSGRHGTAYYKRITSEMFTPYRGEYGVEAGSGRPPVGGGWRHGENKDLEKSADIVGPRFARQVARLPERWFW